MKVLSPVAAFSEGYTEVDVLRFVEEKRIPNESHKNFIGVYADRLDIACYIKDTELPKETTKFCSLDSLEKRSFIVPIAQLTGEINQYPNPFNLDYLIDGEREFFNIAVNYLRNAIQHNIGFLNSFSFKETLVKRLNSKSLELANYIIVDFDLMGEPIISLLGIHHFKNFDDVSISTRFLDPRLLAILMITLLKTHNKFKEKGLKIVKREYTENSKVFKNLVNKPLEAENTSKKLRGDQPVVVPENTVIVSEEDPSDFSKNTPLLQPTKLPKRREEPTMDNNQEMQQPFAKGAQMQHVRKGYESLARILERALDQAQNGKGNERHQIGDAVFDKQPICELGRLYGTGYNFGQAAKKAHETNQLPNKQAKLNELYGAINYLAAAAILIEEGE